MVQSNLTSPATNTFSVTSSSTSRAWNSNTTIFYGDTIGGGQTAFFNYTGSCAASLVGVAGHDSSGGGGVKFGGAEFSTTNPLLFYSGGAANGGAARATLNQYLQDGTTGAGSWGTAHITATTRLDPINCPGLTSYNSGPLGNYWNKYFALSLADGSVGTGSTPVQAGDYRPVQDQSSLIITYDPSQAGHGCRWLDLKSGQVGGDYGSSGLTTGFGPLPAPVAPSVSVQGTNATGSLILGHTYAVQTTYAIVGTGNVYSGESTPSPITLAAVSGFCFLGGIQVSCGLFVTPPAANPGGGSGINLTMTAQAFNAYVCDRTANPSCTPTLQTNSTNASGTLAQPVITSITGCAAGSTSYTFYVIAKNTGGESIPSAGVTVNSVKDSATGSIHCVLNYATVANATSYDATVDSLTTFAGNFANSSCSGGACAQTVNLGVGINTSSYAVASNPIATTPVISSINTTSPQPPTINMAGPMFHNLRMEPSGQWIVISVANSFSILQPGAVKAPMGYLWHISTNILIPCGQGIQSLPYASYCMQHWTHHAGTMFATLQVPNATALAQTTFNDNTATMNGSTVFLGLSQEALDTQSGDEHLSGNYLAGPIFRDGYPIANPYVLPSVPYNGELIAYPLSGGAPFRFCHTWDSGAQGFYSTPRGNVSQDGTVMIFESDNLRNGNGTQGTASGNGSFGGASTCTAGLTSPSTNACRYDVYVCQLK
jgi:hypothetical protein